MITALQLAEFLISAIATQITTGLGLAALLISALLSSLRFRFLWQFAPWSLFTVSASYLDWDGDKSPHILGDSDLLFLTLVYAVICIAGHILGVLSRQTRRR